MMKKSIYLLSILTLIIALLLTAACKSLDLSTINPESLLLNEEHPALQKISTEDKANSIAISYSLTSGDLIGIMKFNSEGTLYIPDDFKLLFSPPTNVAFKDAYDKGDWLKPECREPYLSKIISAGFGIDMGTVREMIGIHSFSLYDPDDERNWNYFYALDKEIFNDLDDNGNIQHNGETLSLSLVATSMGLICKEVGASLIVSLETDTIHFLFPLEPADESRGQTCNEEYSSGIYLANCLECANNPIPRLVLNRDLDDNTPVKPYNADRTLITYDMISGNPIEVLVYDSEGEIIESDNWDFLPTNLQYGGIENRDVTLEKQDLILLSSAITGMDEEAILELLPKDFFSNERNQYVSNQSSYSAMYFKVSTEMHYEDNAITYSIRNETSN